MKKAYDMVFFKLETELVLALTEEELDEGVLIDDKILTLLLWINYLAEEWNHVLGQCSDLVMLRKSLNNLH